MKPLQNEIEKEYSARGPLHQFRFFEARPFHCFRCGTSKKAKLVTIYRDDWSRRVCNGCYGRLLSIYDIKAGSGNDDEKAAALGSLLLSLFRDDQVRESERLFKLSENRGKNLSEKALRFVATSEHVSRALEEASELDWSAATVGLCKAVEAETVERIIKPLAQFVRAQDLENDLKDKDIGRVAKFYKDTTTPPPELGTFAHFLQTALNSEKRRETSPLIQEFLRLTTAWPNSNWLLDPTGFYESLLKLTKDFRNKAAHIEELTKSDYEACRDFVIGEAGILWRLLLATQPYKAKLS